MAEKQKTDSNKETVMIPEYRRASDRDVMLDMLSKRAILDYGERVCSQQECPTTYVVIFDLDNFKVVNDSFGHMFGDQVLHTVTRIINQVIGINGMVGRIGGDEIMIITRGIADKVSLRPFMRDIRMRVEDEFKDRLNGISLTCSMGAAAYPDHGESFESVMDLADKMLYLAKEKGRNRYIIYTPEMHADLISDAKGEGGLKSVFAKTFDKMSLIQYMMDDYLLNGISSNEQAFANVGEAFGLQEILIVYERGKIGFRWTPDNVSHSADDLNWMELDDRFYSLFNRDNLIVVDGLYDLTGEKEFLLEKVTKRQVQSALFYRIRFRDDDPQGFLMFAKKGQRQKWSEYELLALSTIGKIFELSLRASELAIKKK